MSWKLRFGAMIAAATLSAGCSSLTSHRGFMAEEVLLQAIQPGIDNKQSVERTLGRPTFESQFGDPVWYYVASTTRQAPFASPRIAEQTVLAVHFDAAGNVDNVQRSGVEQVARISPNGDKTPTLGRHRGFFEDLFGNIGQVGAGGAGAGAGGAGGS